MRSAPNFIGTSMDQSSTYISKLPPVPPIMLQPPLATFENSTRFIRIPPKLQPTRAAATAVGKSAVDRFRELVAKFRT